MEHRSWMKAILLIWILEYMQDGCREWDFEIADKNGSESEDMKVLKLSMKTLAVASINLPHVLTIIKKGKGFVRRYIYVL